ncbi:hypothetical protein AVEN_40097-1 [Araneus ventricosus]|uniref:Uncharacterized protein n=1 Tax=Araneus ventricosus TaxID=182803 RepID=A0A4Y2IZP1_ARAVE|nr:hypothetical protein AVEN_40097-1 [Araneus ventricosus]
MDTKSGPREPRNNGRSDGPLADNSNHQTDSLRMACLASKASDRCGSDVQDIAIEVLTRADITYRTCSAASEEILEELLSLLKLRSEEDASLNRFLRKE